MNKIQYNEREEAYEIQYKLWGKETTVRFYVENQQDIFDNFSEIAQKLDCVDRNKKKIAEIIIDDGRYDGGSAETLEKHLVMESAYIDLDEDGAVVCFTVDSSDGYLSDKLAIELGADNGLEITGWV